MLAPVEQLECAIQRFVEWTNVIDGLDIDRSVATEALIRLERGRERLGAVSGHLVSDLEARQAHVFDGAYSMANWLTSQTGQARSVTASRARLGRKLREMPATSTALDGGEITESHARVLCRALNPRTTEAFARDEATLVREAKALTADELAKLIEHWLRFNDQDGPAPKVEGHDDRFWLSRTLDGRLKGTLDLGGTLGLQVERALDEICSQLLARDKTNRDVDPTDPALDQTASQRRARALGVMAERAAASNDNPAKRLPLFSVHTTVDTLAGTGDPAEWLLEIEHAWKALIPDFEVHLAACDCWMSEIIIRKADGHPLDLGREQRTASAAQRRALVARDGNGCAVPGCDRPTGWCDAHHVIHWVTPEGHPDGATDIDNLVHLCRWHHRRIHLKDLAVAMADGTPTFTNRNGDVLREPRGPSRGPGSDADVGPGSGPDAGDDTPPNPMRC